MKAFFRARPFWPLILLCLSLAMGLAMPARAATCAGMADILAQLSAKYGEMILWQGQMNDGSPLIITAAPDGTTWTLLGRDPDGRACLLSAGAEWRVGGEAPAAGKEG